jgi:hypothetical protein
MWVSTWPYNNGCLAGCQHSLAHILHIRGVDNAQHMCHLWAMSDDQKSEVVAVRDVRVPLMMSADERARIQAAAVKAGLSLSAFLRTKALEASDGG